LTIATQNRGGLIHDILTGKMTTPILDELQP
jgi:hypothetical protein